MRPWVLHVPFIREQTSGFPVRYYTHSFNVLDQWLGSLAQTSDDPCQELFWIIRKVAGAKALPGTRLLEQTYTLLSPEERNTVDKFVRKRSQGIPLGYVLGTVPFLQATIRVSPSVLIPRPETEEMTNLAIQAIRPLLRDRCQGSLWDMGTGSGCIAIACKMNLPSLKVTGSDISLSALKTAQDNEELNRVDITWEHIPFLNQPVDWMVTNLPYIPRNAPLPPSVAQHEPSIALFGGERGTELYERVLPTLHHYVCHTAWCEIGEDQGHFLTSLMDTTYWKVSLKKDLFGKERFLVAQRRHETTDVMKSRRQTPQR